MVSLKKLIERLENTYLDEKLKECEDLHNAIAEVLAEKRASIQNTFFVLEMIRFELLRAKYQELLGNVMVPLGGGVKKKAELRTEEFK